MQREEGDEREEEETTRGVRRKKRSRREILSRMNQAAERVLFLAPCIRALRCFSSRNQGGGYLEAGVVESASPI